MRRPGHCAWQALFGISPKKNKEGLLHQAEEMLKTQAMVPSHRFGYWGGYRDRLAASAHDTFGSHYSALPAARLRETKGKRLCVKTPENVCVLRWGQSWSACVEEERAISAEKIDSVADQSIAFLLSLGYIEHAARMRPTHLAVHDTIISMYRQATFTPRLHPRVEVHVLPAGGVETEYINCHPQTGFRPYFDAHTVRNF